MDLPKTIKIGCITYKTEERQDLQTHNEEGMRLQLNGHIITDTSEIRLDLAMSPDRKRCVLLHEIIHGVCFNAGVDDLEHKLDEQAIDFLAHGLLDVMRTNKGLIDYLLEEDHVG